MADSQAVLEPAEGNLVGAALVGISSWLVVGVVLLAQRDELAERGTSWWAWTALAGVGVGLVQLMIYVQRVRLRSARGGASQYPTAGVGPLVDPPT